MISQKFFDDFEIIAQVWMLFLLLVMMTAVVFYICKCVIKWTKE
jgi:hypothetical protein